MASGSFTEAQSGYFFLKYFLNRARNVFCFLSTRASILSNAHIVTVSHLPSLWSTPIINFSCLLSPLLSAYIHIVYLLTSFVELMSKLPYDWGLPWCPVVKALPFDAGGVAGSTSGQGAQTQNRSSVVTSSINTWEMVRIKEIFFKNFTLWPCFSFYYKF